MICLIHKAATGGRAKMLTCKAAISDRAKMLMCKAAISDRAYRLLFTKALRAALAKAITAAGSFRPGLDSTPLAVSTAAGRT